MAKKTKKEIKAKKESNRIIRYDVSKNIPTILVDTTIIAESDAGIKISFFNNLIDNKEQLLFTEQGRFFMDNDQIEALIDQLCHQRKYFPTEKENAKKIEAMIHKNKQ